MEEQLIPRYTREKMGKIWQDENRYQAWLEVELAACQSMALHGIVPHDIPDKLLMKKWDIGPDDVRAIDDIEAKTKHDVIAFLTHVERTMGPDARWLHLGMTSSDVLDTSFGILLKQACDLILFDLDELISAVRNQARIHQNTLMVGRTHGIHAEPTTLGLVMAIWYQELLRQKTRLLAARQSVAVGKLSGAVGTFAHLPPEVEADVCAKLGLSAAPISNQVVQRDRHAELFSVLANLGASMEKMAITIRHLQRTEVGEASEPFSEKQRGSSAMPHKKNPIGSENLTGVARLLRSYAMAALEDVALWHERDISHSSVERVIAPDATILTDYALARLTRIIDGLVVRPDRMKENLELTHGLVFSQTVLLALVRAGMEREGAYALVQRNAMLSWDSGEAFLELLLKDQDVVEALGEDGIRKCFDMKELLSRVDVIMRRVFS